MICLPRPSPAQVSPGPSPTSREQKTPRATGEEKQRPLYHSPSGAADSLRRRPASGRAPFADPSLQAWGRGSRGPPYSQSVLPRPPRPYAHARAPAAPPGQTCSEREADPRGGGGRPRGRACGRRPPPQAPRATPRGAPCRPQRGKKNPRARADLVRRRFGPGPRRSFFARSPEPRARGGFRQGQTRSGREPSAQAEPSSTVPTDAGPPRPRPRRSPLRPFCPRANPAPTDANSGTWRSEPPP